MNHPESAHVLHGMRRLLLVLLLCVTGCTEGRACTLIGADPGINVEGTASQLEVCWSGGCRTAKVESGFARVEGLPQEPVEVRVGAQKTVVTPKLVYPNGEHCGGLGPQAAVIVEQDGSVHERP